MWKIKVRNQLPVWEIKIENLKLHEYQEVQDQSLNEAEAIYNASNWISYESTDSQVIIMGWYFKHFVPDSIMIMVWINGKTDSVDFHGLFQNKYYKSKVAYSNTGY